MLLCVGRDSAAAEISTDGDVSTCWAYDSLADGSTDAPLVDASVTFTFTHLSSIRVNPDLVRNVPPIAIPGALSSPVNLML